MKRILSVILLLVFAWTFCPISRAMTIYTTHFVPELDMTITIPKDYLVYTRETDVEVIKNILLENNIYLDAIDTTTNSELFIVMEDYDLVDFNELGEKEINMLSSFALATLNEKEIQGDRPKIQKNNAGIRAILLVSKRLCQKLSIMIQLFHIRYGYTHKKQALSGLHHIHCSFNSQKIDHSSEVIRKERKPHLSGNFHFSFG